MNGKETFLTPLTRLNGQLRAVRKTASETPLVTQSLSCGLWFLMAHILARIRFGDWCAPFGIALTGAAGPGLGGLCAVLGACLGSISALGLVNGLRAAAAAILVYAVSFAFYDSELYLCPRFLPLSAAAVTAVTGLLLLAEDHWRPLSALYLAAEVVITAGAVYVFRRALFAPGIRPEVCSDLILWIRTLRQADAVQRGCVLLLSAALLSSLAGFEYYGISPAAGAALSLSLILGGYRAPQAGACAGALYGFAVDLAQTGLPVHAPLFCLSGMIAGLLTWRRRLPAAISALALSILFSLIWEPTRLTLPPEAVIGILPFLLIPRRRLLFLRERTPAADPVSPELPAAAQVRIRLEAQSAAFHSLYDHLNLALSEAIPPSCDPMQVFVRASERVCINCIRRTRCWHRDYTATRTTLQGTLPRLLERGSGTASDFDSAFVDGCAHFRAFLAAVNLEVSNLLAQRQFQARVRANRAAVCRQYGELARLLSAAAVELTVRPDRDAARSKRLEHYLRDRGYAVGCGVIYDRSGHLMVELLGSDLSQLDQPELPMQLSRLLHLSLRRGHLSAQPEGQRLTLVQLEPYAVSAGISATPRSGNSVSGDTCRWFKGEDGVLRVILCDGMGCGAAAAGESRLLVRLLEDLLRADIDPESALHTLCGAMSLRGELGGGLSTVDLLTIDLFSCSAVLYKLGAAPSYLCRGAQVRRISGGALPAGAGGSEQKAEITRCQLEHGDLLLLVSDGISDGTEDGWLSRTLLDGRNLDARSLSAAILRRSADHTGCRDDRTVAALRLNRRQVV